MIWMVLAIVALLLAGAAAGFVGFFLLIRAAANEALGRGLRL